jgi:hypothetical protein
MVIDAGTLDATMLSKFPKAGGHVPPFMKYLRCLPQDDQSSVRSFLHLLLSFVTSAFVPMPRLVVRVIFRSYQESLILNPQKSNER